MIDSPLSHFYHAHLLLLRANCSRGARLSHTLLSSPLRCGRALGQCWGCEIALMESSWCGCGESDCSLRSVRDGVFLMYHTPLVAQELRLAIQSKDHGCSCCRVSQLCHQWGKGNSSSHQQSRRCCWQDSSEAVSVPP
jgi:hypothetical protein